MSKKSVIKQGAEENSGRGGKANRRPSPAPRSVHQVDGIVADLRFAAPKALPGARTGDAEPVLDTEYRPVVGAQDMGFGAV